MPKLPDVSQLRPVATPQAPIQVPTNNPVYDAISGLGNVFADIVKKEKLKDDHYRTESANNKLLTKSLELQKAFSEKKSGDVAEDKEFFQKYMAEFEGSIGDISEKLTNDEQRQAFNSRMEVAKRQYQLSLMNHITQQKDVYHDQVYKGGISVEEDNAAANYYNKNAVKTSLLRVENLSKERADALGLKGDAREAVIKQNKSNIHMEVIKAAVDNSPEYAELWYKENKKDILGTEHAKIEKLLETANVREISQSKVDSYVAQGLSETEAREKARKELKGAARDATIARIQARYGEAEQIRERDQRQASEVAWDIISTQGYDAIPNTILDRVSGKDRIALQAYDTKIKSGPIKTVPEAYYELQFLMNKQPDKFQKTNLLQYKHLLKEEHLTYYMKAQQDPKVLDISATRSDIIMQGIARAGFEPKLLKQTGSDGDKARAIYDRIISEERQEVEATGKPLPKGQLKKIADRVAIQVLREDAGWFWRDIEEPVGLIQIEGVPTHLIDDIAERLHDNNQPVTEEAIVNEYIRTFGR